MGLVLAVVYGLTQTAGPPVESFAPLSTDPVIQTSAAESREPAPPPPPAPRLQSEIEREAALADSARQAARDSAATAAADTAAASSQLSEAPAEPASTSGPGL